MNITEMEVKLRGANADLTQLDVLTQLNVTEQRLLQQMAQGVQPEQFNVLQACANACSIAKKVVQAYSIQGTKP